MKTINLILACAILCAFCSINSAKSELNKINTNGKNIPFKDILRTMPDKKKYISHDYGVTWKEVVKSEKDNVFNVKSLFGDINVKSDSIKNSTYRIKLFNAYGELLMTRIIDSEDFHIILSEVSNPLVIYSIERNGVAIQRGKLIIN